MYIDEINYLNEKASKLVTERNEAQAKLEIFRIEIQNLRSHIASPLVQKSIQNKVSQAKKILERKTNSKEDVENLKSILLHLEDGFARLKENEKIYHRLLLQKEVEIKNVKEFQREMNKKYPAFCINDQDSKLSTVSSNPYISVENSYTTGRARKSNSFCLFAGDDVTTKRKPKHERNISEQEDNRLIDEIALLKVKIALYEENICERDEKIKSFLKKIKDLIDSFDELYEVKQNLHFAMQIIMQPIAVQELTIDDIYFDG